MRLLRTWPVVLLVAFGCDGGSVPSTSGSGSGGQGGQGGTPGTGGSPPEANCWSSAIDAWELEPFDMNTLAGGTPRDPMLSADGLTLYYSAHSESAIPRIYEASRASRDLRFEGGTLLAEWLGQNPLGHPWRVGEELFMAEDNNLGVFHVVVSTFDGSSWNLPAPPSAQLNEGRSNGDPTLTEDGHRIVFSRQLADNEPVRLVEGARSDASPGTPFSTFSDVAIPGVAADNFVICPALSPNGRILFFSTVDVTSAEFASVWVTERNSVDHAWEAPVRISVFDVPSQHVCVHVLSSDGCEVWLEHFEPQVVVSNYVIAKRRPL